MIDRRTLLKAAPLALIGAQLSRRARAQTTQDPTELLRQAGETMLALSSFHFELSVPKGSSNFGGALELGGIVGDVLRPKSFKADITAKTALFSITVHTIGVDGQIWATNPLSGGDNWMQIASEEEMSQLPALLNPDTLILAAVQLVGNPAIAGTESLDGQDTTRIDGVFAPGALTELGGTPTPELPMIANRQLDVSIWIDDEYRVPRVDFVGPFTDDDSSDVVRRLDVSAFNEPVTIEPPA
jgi:hypothetical protein